jgi:hypothetical protein
MGFQRNVEKRAQGCIQVEKVDRLQAIPIKKTNIMNFHPCVFLNKKNHLSFLTQI